MPKSTKVELFGYTFDSIPEAERAKYLISLEESGVITNLRLDKSSLKIQLQDAIVIPPIPKLGTSEKKISAITYEVDYSYHWNGLLIYEDWKSLRVVSTRKGVKFYKPHVERDSKLRIKMCIKKFLHEPAIVFRVVSNETANPDDIDGYWYSLNEPSITQF